MSKYLDFKHSPLHSPLDEDYHNLEEPDEGFERDIEDEIDD